MNTAAVTLEQLAVPPVGSGIAGVHAGGATSRVAAVACARKVVVRETLTVAENVPSVFVLTLATRRRPAKMSTVAFAAPGTEPVKRTDRCVTPLRARSRRARSVIRGAGRESDWACAVAGMLA